MSSRPLKRCVFLYGAHSIVHHQSTDNQPTISIQPFFNSKLMTNLIPPQLSAHDRLKTSENLSASQARFPEVATLMAPYIPPPPPPKGGLFSCFGGAGDREDIYEEPNSPDSSGPGHLALLSNIDSLNVSHSLGSESLIVSH